MHICYRKQEGNYILKLEALILYRDLKNGKISY